MKYLLFGIVLFCGIMLHGQQKANAVIKTNGDTVWCDKATIRYELSNKIKEVQLVGGPVTEIDGKEVAFVMFSDGIILFSEEGYNFDEVIIYGAEYYLTVGMTTQGLQYFQILDKNRKFIKRLNKSESAVYDQLEEYFGDCPGFIKEIDKVADDPEKKNINIKILQIAKHYNCK